MLQRAARAPIDVKASGGIPYGRRIAVLGSQVIAENRGYPEFLPL